MRATQARIFAVCSFHHFENLTVLSRSRTLSGSSSSPRPGVNVSTGVDVSPLAPASNDTPVVERAQLVSSIEAMRQGDFTATPGLRMQVLLEPTLRSDHVDAVVEFLQCPGMQLEAVRLDLSNLIEPAALSRLLTAIEAHPELRSLQLLVDGSPLGPIPEAFRLLIAGSKVCLDVGGIALRQMLFGPCIKRLEGILEELQCEERGRNATDRIERRIALVSQLRDGLLLGQPSTTLNAQSIESEVLRDVLRLLNDDGAALLAIAMLSHDGRLSLTLDSANELRTCQVLDHANVPYGLHLRCVGHSQWMYLEQEWLPKDHRACQAMTLTMSLNTLQAFRRLVEMLSTSLGSLQSMTVVVYKKVDKCPDKWGGRSSLGLVDSLCSVELVRGAQGLDEMSIHVRPFDIKKQASVIGALKPRFLKLRADRSETIVKLLTALASQSLPTLSQLQIGWTELEQDEVGLHAQWAALSQRFAHLQCVFVDPPLEEASEELTGTPEESTEEPTWRPIEVPEWTAFT